MFSNFKKAFKEKPQFSDNPPQAVINAISSELPGKFRYIHDHDGFCRIDIEEGLRLESGTIEVPLKARNILSYPYKKEEVFKYAYNSQKPLKVKPDEEGNFIINGEKINIMDFVKVPLKNMQFTGAEVYLQPPEFPEAFPLTVGDASHSLELMVRRVPNDSLNVQAFESVDNNVIAIGFKIDDSNDPISFTFNIRINLVNAKNASDIVKACEIYNSFLEGKGLIAGEAFDNQAKQNVKKISQETISFWKKVVSIEQRIGRRLELANEITYLDVKNIEDLYRSLIEGIPTKAYNTYTSVRGKGSLEAISKIEKGQEIYLEFEEAENLRVMGNDINVFALKGIFCATVILPKDYDLSKETEYEVQLAPVANKKMYCSYQYFFTEDALDEYRKDSAHIEKFRMAEEVHVEQ